MNAALMNEFYCTMDCTLADLYDAHEDDEAEGDEFARGEHILYTRRPADMKQLIQVNSTTRKTTNYKHSNSI